MGKSEGAAPSVIAQFGQELAGIAVGEPVTWQRATFVPLIWTTDRDLDVALLEEEPGVDVEELGQGRATVPEIKIRNRSDKFVLVTDGSLVEGAYQNRVINVTFLVAPKSERVVPVSCVEAGRWGGRGLRFKPRRKAPPMLRARARREIQAEAERQGHIGRANQGRVWRDVALYLAACGRGSPSENFVEAMVWAEEEVAREGTLDDLTAELNRRGEGRTAGVATVWGNRVAAVDLFGLPRLFEKAVGPILTAYLLDLRLAELPKGKEAGDGKVVREFLAQLPRFANRRKPTIGVGDELEISGPECTGNAVLYKGKLYHMSVFGVV